MAVLEFFSAAAGAGLVTANAALFDMICFFPVPDPLHDISRGTPGVKLIEHVVHVWFNVCKKQLITFA